MAHPYINRQFYDAIIHFDSDEAAQEYYYSVMNSELEKNGRRETVRHQILRVYAMLFCDHLGAVAGQIAGPEDVIDTADCLYIGGVGLDLRHWYRMQHHFPVIDEDNYDRFAALVIADLSAGPLREAALHGDGMLLVGEANPLCMTRAQRQHQRVRIIDIGGALQ